MSIKALPARGIYGWDSTNETWVKVKVDSNGNVNITNTSLTTILEEIQDSTYGLEALDTDLGTILTRLGSPVGASVSVDIASIKTVVDSILTDTANLPSDPADASDIAADLDRHLTSLDFWGDPIATVQISTGSAVKSLGTITVPALPTGATIWKVRRKLDKCF